MRRAFFDDGQAGGDQAAEFGYIGRHNQGVAFFGEFAEGGVQAQTRQSLENMKAILAEAGLTMNDVVKTTVFLADMGDFGAMNEVYSTFFQAPFPARCAYAVKTLPKNALVEIECIATR